MNCAEFQDFVVIGIHGKLTAGRQEEVDRHRSACAGCAALYERFEPLLKLQAQALEEAASAPTPDGEGSWAAIAKRALPEKGPFSLFFGRIPRWALATAGILVIFVLGYVAGRSILVDSVTYRPGTAELSPSGHGPSLVFASYAESLKPVLMSFLNRGDVVPPDGLRTLERGIIRDMLSQTRVLRGLAGKTGDAALADLLDDLEIILTSLANLAPGDEASAALLERIIREKGVPLRLRGLASPMTI